MCIDCKTAHYRAWYEKNHIQYNYKNRLNTMLGKKAFGRSAKPGKIEWLNK